MTPEDLEPLDPELQAALDTERRRPDPDTAVKQRVLLGVTTALAFPSGGGPGSAAPPDASGSTSIAHATSASATASKALLAKAVLGTAVAAFALGVATGVVATRTPSAQSVPTTAPQVSAPRGIGDQPSRAPTALAKDEASSAPVVNIEDLPASSPTSGGAKRGTTRPARTAGPTANDDLASQRALLDAARTALERGQAANALTSLDRYGAQFPKGQLAEESDALRVQALVMAGRNDEARAAGATFRQRYPTSMFRPAVDAALGAIR